MFSELRISISSGRERRPNASKAATSTTRESRGISSVSPPPAQTPDQSRVVLVARGFRALPGADSCCFANSGEAAATTWRGSSFPADQFRVEKILADRYGSTLVPIDPPIRGFLKYQPD